MQIVLPIHILTAALGIVSGVVALSAPKGATLHRKSGMLFVCAMTVMCATATVLAASKGQIVNVLAGLTTAYLVITALTTVRRASKLSHRLNAALMLAALVLGLTTLTIGFAAVGSASGTKYGYPPFPFFMFGLIGVLGSAGDFLVMWHGPLRGAARLTRHLWRMCSALWIATASFFLVPTRAAMVLPGPLLSLRPLPVLLVLVAMLYWLWRVRTKRTFRTVPSVDAAASSSA